MKVLVILLVLFSVSFFAVNHAYGLWFPQSAEELLEESQVIVVGNITSVKELELEQPLPSENSLLVLDQYTVTVEEFVKNPQDTDTITVRQPTVSTPGRLLPHGGFEIGDRVLFYIESFDGTNTYSKESFLIPKQCNTSSVIHEPRIIGSSYTMMQNGIEKKDNFTANSPIQFVAKNNMGTLSGASLEYDAFISKQVGKIYKERVFHQTITADAKPCEWLSVAEWEFTPDAGNYLLNGGVYKEKSRHSISNTFFSVLPESPLKQIQSGISFDEIQCKQNLLLIQKYDDSPACVTESTKKKLIERGWSLSSNNRIKIENTNLFLNYTMSSGLVKTAQLSDIAYAQFYYETMGVRLKEAHALPTEYSINLDLDSPEHKGTISLQIPNIIIASLENQNDDWIIEMDNGTITNQSHVKMEQNNSIKINYPNGINHIKIIGSVLE